MAPLESYFKVLACVRNVLWPFTYQKGLASYECCCLGVLSTMERIAVRVDGNCFGLGGVSRATGTSQRTPTCSVFAESA